MSYQLVWSEESGDCLSKFDNKARDRILLKVKKIADSESLNDIKRLKGVQLYSLRIGDYRAILNIDLRLKRIVVIRIGHRKNVYDRI